MLARFIDRTVGVFSPQRALARLSARATLKQIEKILGGESGYNAAKLSRLTSLKQNLHENAISSAALDRLDGAARDLYRNNPHARKIVRQIETKTIGTGMRPQSQAKLTGGKPHLKFRMRALAVWGRFLCESDYRGRPAHGGQNLSDQAKTALRSISKTGNVLYRMKPLSEGEQRRRGLLLPVVLQLIDAGRLDTSIQSANDGQRVYRGIELDADGRPAAYHLYSHHPSDPLGDFGTSSQRVRAEEVGHAYLHEEIDQILGVSWFAAALDPLRDSGDYQYNELKAAAMGACVVAGIKRPTGAAQLGLAAPDGEDLTDADGNKITRLQPGMFFDLGSDGEITGFNPQRPNTNAEAFIQHLLRVTAGAVPGIKGSTLTGDYRRSSFASEKSADNDIWPEIEGVQAWFSCAFYQPIYEAVLDTAVLMGLFDDVISAGEYVARRGELIQAIWQGPVARSIQQQQDEEASALAIRNGTSSPQIEAGKRGRDTLEILQQVKEYYDQLAGTGLPPAIVEQMMLQVLGIGSDGDALSTTKAPEAETETGEAETDEELTDDDEDRGLFAFRLPALVGGRR